MIFFFWCYYLYIILPNITKFVFQYMSGIWSDLKCMLCVYFRKLRDADEQNRELMASVAKREEGLHQNNVRGFVCVGFLLDLMSEVAHCSRIELGEEWLSVDWLCSCLQLRLEEKSRENASLTRQLENALSDIRRQTEQTRDKALQKVNEWSL